MNSYGLIDLHCDTLADWKYANTGNPDTLDDPGRVLQLSNMPNDVHWAQFYAVFIPDEERGDAAIAYFEKNRINFYRQMEKFSDRVAPCRNAADIYRHTMHFFELGGKKNLALGSDFDGSLLPECLNTPAKAASIYEYLISRGVSQEDADGVMYKNAQEFFRKNLR